MDENGSKINLLLLTVINPTYYFPSFFLGTRKWNEISEMK